MLIEKKETIVERLLVQFRIEKELVQGFRKMCKENNVSQVTVIKNAMMKAMEEMNNLSK